LQAARELRSLAALLTGLAILAAAANLRGSEYDEAYTIGLAAGHRLPEWPRTAFLAAEAKAMLTGSSTASSIAAALYRSDVHPPLYFWLAALWRACAGDTWRATREFSVLLSFAALALTGGIAKRLAIPAPLAILLTATMYGFAYTGSIARPYALAQCLCLAGVRLVLIARARARAAAGIALGLACLSNYLALFPAAAILWRLRKTPRQAFAVLLGMAPSLPAGAAFFLAQRHARPDQFAPFAPLATIARLLRYQAAAIFGGLPLYAGAAATLVTIALATLAACLAFALARDWRRIAAGNLLLPLAAAPALGLLLLAVLGGSSPIELRYFAPGLPPLALLLAASLARRPFLRAVFLCVQACAIAGLLLMPQTMQPQAAATAEAARATALVLVPKGNDGAGIVLPVIEAAPPAMRLAVLGKLPDLSGETRLTVLNLPIDRDSRGQLEEAQTALRLSGWRQTGATRLTQTWQLTPAPRKAVPAAPETDR
jgi:hypothetical protein